MSHHGVALLDAAAARAGDAAAVDAGDTWAGLMHRAAGHLARGVEQAAGPLTGRRVVVCVGSGNNGGDGWSAAPRLRDRGAGVEVVSTAPLDADLSDEAAAARAAWLGSGGHAVVGIEAAGAALERADVVVDCLLGTGSTGAPRGDVGPVVAAIRAARTRGAVVVACDIPTGVESDTGAAHDAVVADLTVTFGGLKRGLVLQPGAGHTGRIVVGDLGPRYAPPEVAWRALGVADALPATLGASDDKRARGVALAVAGSVGAGGAAILCTRGLLYAGAGLVTLATPAHVQRVIVPAVPSAMTRPLRHSGEHVSADAVDQLDDVDAFDVVVAGPGLGPTAGTRAVADHLRASARRLVLDADAVNVYRDDPDALATHAGDLVLTPHARELARIGGGRDGDEAWAQRVERVPALARDLDATIVAKGPSTIVAAPDGRIWVTPIGGPELGTGGTGDVLAGMVAAAVSTADDVPLATARAVWWHAFAGAWLARGRPAPDAMSTTVGGTDAFGPASELAVALPAAQGMMRRLAAFAPGWPLPEGLA